MRIRDEICDVRDHNSGENQSGPALGWFFFIQFAPIKLTVEIKGPEQRSGSSPGPVRPPGPLPD